MDVDKIPLRRLKRLKIFQDKYYILLAVFILIASLLAFRYLTTQTVFGYDMARDAFHAHAILYEQNVKILGPGTDIPGLNHGVLWFYVLVIPYFLSRQDPQFAVMPFFLMSVATIPFVWLLAQRLFKDRRVSFISTILYGFSPLVVTFASWISNPILCMYATPPLLLTILSFIEKPNIRKGLVIGILYGVLIQSQLANLLLLGTIPLFALFFKIRPSVKVVVSLVVGFILTLGSYILVEVTFNYRGVVALLEFLNSHHGAGPKIQFIMDKTFEFFQLTIFPFHHNIVMILIIFVFVTLISNIKKYKKPVTFLLIWLSNILLFTLFDTGVSHSSFVFIPSISAGVILVSFVLVKVISKKLILGIAVLLMIIFQVKTVFEWQADDFSPAAIQRSNTTYRYKQVVDYTYQSSSDAFTIVTVTNPLFINTTWAYLYEFYGKPKYGYEPFWGGRGQAGYPGSLVEKTFGTKERYLIIESTIGIPSIYVTKALYEEERVSDLVEERKFGYVRVQKRTLSSNKGEIEIPEELRKSHILHE